jgi:hypothetical protein
MYSSCHLCFACFPELCAFQFEREVCLLATRERFAKAGEEEEEEKEEEDRVQELRDGLLVCL